VLLITLLRLYREFDRRVKEAQITADGMPDLGDSVWVVDFEDGLWPTHSPLAGLVEDVSPFGSQREWETRLQELDGQRAHQHRPRPQAHAKPDDQQQVDTSAYDVDSSSLAGAAAGDVPPTPASNILDLLDRGLATVDTLIGFAAAFQVEGLLALELTSAAGGMIMQVISLTTSFMRADMQQEAAAKALGVAFGYFALVKMLERKNDWLPDQVTEERLRRHFEPNPMTSDARANLRTYRGSTPEQVLIDAERAGLLMVVDLVNKCLARVPELAKERHRWALYEISMAMKDKGRLSQEQQKRIMDEVKEKLTVEGVAEEIKRRTYQAVVQRLQDPCSATLRRIGRR
jgi:hypothetical protein